MATYRWFLQARRISCRHMENTPVVCRVAAIKGRPLGGPRRLRGRGQGRPADGKERFVADSSILIIDDDEDTCETVSDLLAEFGYEADIAHDGREALRLAGQKEYRLALLDFRMPDLDGVETFVRLRRITGDMHGLLVTGEATEATAGRAAEAGIQQVVPKPLDAAMLISLVGDLMAGSP